MMKIIPLTNRKQDLAVGDLSEGGMASPESHGCAPGEVYDGTIGRCVRRDLVDLWNPEKQLQDLKNEVQRHADMKIRLRQEPDVGLDSLGNRSVDGREDPDPFLELELILAYILSLRAFSLADQLILPLFDDQVLPKDPSRFNQQRLDEANDRATTIWRNNAYNGATASATASALRDSFQAGEAQVSAGILRGAPSVEQVLRNMELVAQWRTNEYFNTQVMPALQKKISDLFENTGAFDTVDIKPIRATLDRRLKSVPYWRVVANAATSRAYHYGLLKASQAQGFTGFRFVAIIDNRTSDICRELNNKTFFIADAVNKIERVAGSDDPDEVKRVFPWVNVEDVRNLSNDALRDLGVQVPPLHGNCRSTLRPIR